MRHRTNQLISGIDGASFVHLAAVFFFMVLVFFLTMPIAFQDGIRPDLPRVGHPVSMARANREDAMVVVIWRDDRVFFGRDQVRPDQLPDKIRERICQGSEKKVYIKADGRAKYGWVADVLDNMRSAGVEKIGFLVDQRPTRAPNPQ